LALYEISIDAENDLSEIAQYTLDKWGIKVFEQYKTGLIQTFNIIGNNEAIEKVVSKAIAGVFVTSQLARRSLGCKKKENPSWNNNF
jgi:toxin ParE1/3/4